MFKSLVKTTLTTAVIFWTIIVCFLSLVLVLGAAGNSEEVTTLIPQAEYHFGNEKSDHKLLSIPINGVIMGNKSEEDFGSLFAEQGITYGYSVKEQLYEAAKHDSYSGVILEINSPGGTIYGSQAIADGITHYQEKTKKPVYAFVAGMAASGGYWAAAPADKIIADTGTLVGSIGVISGPFKYYDTPTAEDGGLLSGGIVTQRGIETSYISAGQYKDLGNPFRRMSEEEVTSLQKTLNNEYDIFVKHVVANRPIAEADVKNNIKALIYDPVSALELKLIDSRGNREQAYQELATQAQLSSDDFQVVREHHVGSFFSELFRAQTQTTLNTQTAAFMCSKLTNQILAYHGQIWSLCD